MLLFYSDTTRERSII